MLRSERFCEAGSRKKAQEPGGDLGGGDVPGIALGVMVALWMEKMPSCRMKLLFLSPLMKTSENISCFGNRDKLPVLRRLAERYTSIQRTSGRCYGPGMCKKKVRINKWVCWFTPVIPARVPRVRGHFGATDPVSNKKKKF